MFASKSRFSILELEHFFSDIFIFLKLMLNFVIPNLVHDRWFGHQFILILTEKLKKMTCEMLWAFCGLYE